MMEGIEWDDRKDDNDLFLTTLNNNSDEIKTIEYCKNPQEAIKSKTFYRIVEIIETKNDNLEGLNDFLKKIKYRQVIDNHKIDQLIIYLQEPQTIEALKELSKKLKFIHSQENKDFLNEFILDENGNTDLTKMRDYLVKFLQKYYKTYDIEDLENGVEVGDFITEDLYQSKDGAKILKYDDKKHSIKVIYDFGYKINVKKRENGYLIAQNNDGFTSFYQSGLFKYENGKIIEIIPVNNHVVGIFNNGIVRIRYDNKQIFGKIENNKFVEIGESNDVLNTVFEINNYLIQESRTNIIIIKNDVVFNIDKKTYNIGKTDLADHINIGDYDLIYKNGSIYKFDYENKMLIKVCETKNKKTNAFYELNGKFYVPKKGFIENEYLTGDKTTISLEKSGFSFKNKRIDILIKDITQEQIEKYLDEVTF